MPNVDKMPKIANSEHFKVGKIRVIPNRKFIGVKSEPREVDQETIKTKDMSPLKIEEPKSAMKKSTLRVLRSPGT